MCLVQHPCTFEVLGTFQKMVSPPQEEKISPVTNIICQFWPLVQSCEDPVNKHFTEKEGGSPHMFEAGISARWSQVGEGSRERGFPMTYNCFHLFMFILVQMVFIFLVDC